MTPELRSLALKSTITFTGSLFDNLEGYDEDDLKGNKLGLKYSMMIN